MTYKKQIYCVTSLILCTLAKGMKFLTILLHFFITHVKLTIENIEKLLRAIFMFANGDSKTESNLTFETHALP